MLLLQWSQPQINPLELQWRGPTLLSTSVLKALSTMEEVETKIAVISGPRGADGLQGPAGRDGNDGQVGGIPELLDGGNF